jgi:hypothetical protein
VLDAGGPRPSGGPGDLLAQRRERVRGERATADQIDRVDAGRALVDRVELLVAQPRSRDDRRRRRARPADASAIAEASLARLASFTPVKSTTRLPRVLDRIEPAFPVGADRPTFLEDLFLHFPVEEVAHVFDSLC